MALRRVKVAAGLSQRDSLWHRAILEDSSEPSEQWLTPSQSKSGWMHKPLLQLKSRHACFRSLIAVICGGGNSFWLKTFFWIRWNSMCMLVSFNSHFSLWIRLSLLTTSLKPFESVPQLSVMYFSVTWLVLVKRTPTVCFVLRQEMSIYCWKKK